MTDRCHWRVNDVRCTQPDGHDGDHVVPLMLATVPPTIPQPPSIEGLLARVRDRIGHTSFLRVNGGTGAVVVWWCRSYDGVISDERSAVALSIEGALEAILAHEDWWDAHEAEKAGESE